jgi:pyruvate decarboxylase
LLVGERSLQLTVQEIDSYIRFGFTSIIVINNNRYFIERAINGPQQDYNNISILWDHQTILAFFGARPATEIKSRSFACKTVEELEGVFKDEEFGRAECIQVW